jgi:uncharacterized protein (TIGR00730 family)
MANKAGAPRRIYRASAEPLAADVSLIAAEFLAGFQLVEQIDRPAVSIFGSARIAEGSATYEQARETGRAFAEAGFAVVTGGGPGVMEAANRGAQEAGGLSVGFNVVLPHEQLPNAYLDVSLTLVHFYVRKTMLVKAAEGFVMFPGGFGTLDEMFEALTLIQTGKVRHFPVVLVGTSYWQGLLAWIRDAQLRAGAVTQEDIDILKLTDDPEEVVAIVRDYASRAEKASADEGDLR